jgi:emp24/gp25L/p24 family/GOLD
VSVRPQSRILDTIHHASPIRDRLKPTSLTLLNHTGTLLHKVEVDGEVNICVRVSGTPTNSLAAASAALLPGHGAELHGAYRFALRIHNADQDPLYKKVVSKQIKHLPPAPGDDDVSIAAAAKYKEEQEDLSPYDSHLSHFELEMQRIESGMRHILAEAEFAKAKDALFHKQTVNMHLATTYWPMVQVLVLLMTGFTQASHIVRFFKSRRII